MELSRDTSHSIRPSDELEDDSGLELSLGLSWGGLRNTNKASEGATSVNSTAGHGTDGGGTFERPKCVRRSGLDAALKKFLEGRLDEQEDLGRLLDGYSHQEGAWNPNGSLNNEQETPNNLSNVGSLGSLTVTTNLEKWTDVNEWAWKWNEVHRVSELDGGGNTIFSKENQISDGVTVAWGQPHEQGVSLPFTDALNIGSLGESSAITHKLAEALGHEDEDKMGFQRQLTLHGFEQQRKFQEARKKRKDLIEEQKQHSKAKKEDDRTGPHGFRRPGSNSWVRGLDVAAPALDSEKAMRRLQERKEGKEFQLEIRDTSHLERVRVSVERSFDAEHDESTGIPDNDSKSLEMNLLPQHKPQDVGKFSTGGDGELSGASEDAGRMRVMQALAAVNASPGSLAAIKGALGSSVNQQEEEDSSAVSCERPGSPSKQQNNKTSCPCPSSSAGTDITQKNEEQSCGDDGEASSAPPEVTEGDRAAVSANTASPYPSKSISVMPTCHAVHIPAPNTSGLPISVGFSFPHLRQFKPPTSDSQERSSVQPVTSSASQVPSGDGIRPVQIPTLEAASWVQVLRPPIASFLSAPNSSINRDWTSTGVVEGVNSRPQVAKVQENGSGQQNATSVANNLSVEHQLYNPVSVNFGQAAALSELYQAPSLQSLTSLSVPVIPHCGPTRTLSDPGELQSFKERGGINAFPGFAASVQAAQGLPGVPKLSSNRVEDFGAKQEQAKLSGKADSAALQQVLQTEDGNTMNPKDVGQEDFKQSFGGQYQQGMGEHFPMSDVMAMELAHLKPGIPSGLKFGGTGSSPDLPWVSTTGSGPNGKTVCGVLYRYSRSQVNIVCACHGKHMSPSEFVQHAGGVEVSNPEKNIVVNPFF